MEVIVKKLNPGQTLAEQFDGYAKDDKILFSMKKFKESSVRQTAVRKNKEAKDRKEVKAYQCKFSARINERDGFLTVTQNF